MLLSSFGDIENVTEEILDSYLGHGPGEFAELFHADDDYLSVNMDFLNKIEDLTEEEEEDDDDDSWILEYHDPALGRLQRAKGTFTYSQIFDVCFAFFRKEKDWNAKFTWEDPPTGEFDWRAR